MRAALIALVLALCCIGGTDAQLTSAQLSTMGAVPVSIRKNSDGSFNLMRGGQPYWAQCVPGPHTCVIRASRTAPGVGALAEAVTVTRRAGAL